MKNLDFIGKHKKDIISVLMNDKDIVKLLQPDKEELDEFELEEVLLGGEYIVNGVKKTLQGYIFDYNFINDATEDKRCYIMVECYVPRVEDTLMNVFYLDIVVMCHKSLIRLSKDTVPTKTEMNDKGVYSNRVDGLITLIDNKLNGKADMGIGDLTPLPNGYNKPYQPSNTDYYGKTLSYKVKGLNEGGDTCGY